VRSHRHILVAIVGVLAGIGSASAADNSGLSTEPLCAVSIYSDTTVGRAYSVLGDNGKAFSNFLLPTLFHRQESYDPWHYRTSFGRRFQRVMSRLVFPISADLYRVGALVQSVGNCRFCSDRSRPVRANASANRFCKF
jgi:hypothetical protein